MTMLVKWLSWSNDNAGEMTRLFKWICRANDYAGQMTLLVKRQCWSKDNAGQMTWVVNWQGWSNDKVGQMTMLVKWLCWSNDYAGQMTMLVKWQGWSNDYAGQMAMLVKWLGCPHCNVWARSTDVFSSIFILALNGKSCSSSSIIWNDPFLEDLIFNSSVGKTSELESVLALKGGRCENGGIQIFFFFGGGFGKLLMSLVKLYGSWHWFYFVAACSHFQFKDCSW